jgi:hypothetical protein
MGLRCYAGEADRTSGGLFGGTHHLHRQIGPRAAAHIVQTDDLRFILALEDGKAQTVHDNIMPYSPPEIGRRRGTARKGKDDQVNQAHPERLPEHA